MHLIAFILFISFFFNTKIFNFIEKNTQIMGWSDYTKIKKIGEGSFGSAWLVKSNLDQNQYVIKLINVAKVIKILI